jgi:hypothetical protein
MSERKARLCDIEQSQWHSNLNKTTLVSCNAMAASKCVLCDRDACAVHTMHPKGGLVLKLESIGLDTSMLPALDVPYGADPSNPHNSPGAAPTSVRISVCSECWKSSAHDFGRLLEDVKGDLVSRLRAKLTEKSLTPPRTP